MRAALAIFSLVCLKCGCKKLLAQLASPSEEHEGVAAVGCQGQLPHCLQTFSKGTEAGRSQLPSSVPLLLGCPCCYAYMVFCPGNPKSSVI